MTQSPLGVGWEDVCHKIIGGYPRVLDGSLGFYGHHFLVEKAM